MPDRVSPPPTPEDAKALEAADAKVLAFGNFGSCQGDWWAKVEYEGRVAWAHGAFGSCSGCDAFQAEFDCYEMMDCCASDNRHWTHDPTCAACVAAKAAYDVKFAEFGKGYLGDLFTQEQAETEAGRNSGWDYESKEMVAWLKAHAIVVGDQEG